MAKFVIFTDLDGTLLDYSTYSYEAAMQALHLIKEREVPLIICSSKTGKEIEHYRNKLDNHDPFISENGGGIFLPRGHFAEKVIQKTGPVVYEGAYAVIRLGAHYKDLRRALSELRAEGFRVKGFGDMSVEEIADAAGMKIEDAVMAKARDFDEPFIFEGSADELGRLAEAIREKGLSCTRGRFFHILGNTDKGKAVAVLTELYRTIKKELVTIALGDGLNDLPMLAGADIPVLVKRPEGDYEPAINLPYLVKAEGVGPAGWNTALLDILSDRSFRLRE